MANRLGFVFAMLAVASAVAAAQGKAKPDKGTAAAKGQPYEVEFVFADGKYTGTMMLQIARGAVTGTMVIDSPTRVDGEVAGTLKGDALALDYPYTMREDGCTGRVIVDARMTPDRAEASGTAVASGCSDEPINGTVSLRKSSATTPKK